MKAHAGSFDFILCTASGKMDVAAYMALLKPRKSFCLVGLPPVAEPLNFSPSTWWAARSKSLAP